MNGVFAVDFGEQDIHFVVAACVDLTTHMVRCDGQFAVTAVDQDRQPNPAGPPEVTQRIQRGTYRSSSEQDIVNQGNRAAIHREVDLRASDHGGDTLEFQVVPVQPDVERADLDLGSTQGRDQFSKTLREIETAGTDADQRQVSVTAVSFPHFVSETLERSLDVLGV